MFTLKEYLLNPMGKGSSVIPKSMKDLYAVEVSKINITVKWFKYNDNGAKSKDGKYNRLLAIVNIPSTKVNNVSYEVAIEFNMKGDYKSIMLCPCTVFSNCPSFVYTYAKVFNERGLLIKRLKNKYDAKTLKMDPTIRNSYKIIAYEKSLTMAAIYLSTTPNILNIFNNAVPIIGRSNINAIFNKEIKDVNLVLKTYNIEKAKMQKDKNYKVKIEPKKTQTEKPNSHAVSKVPSVKKTPKVSKIHGTTKVKKVPKVKKI
jgi:hypothetical protein